MVVGPWTAVAFAGALVWGLGAALGFPMGMSAAADDPAHSAPRVSVVASIGYVAFETVMNKAFSDIRNGSDVESTLKQAQQQLTSQLRRIQESD